jgi:hypothetical protein
VTQWVESIEGGRERGPRGLLSAWFEVVFSPRQFFRARVREGDQAPGLVFVVVVVLLAEASRIALVPGAASVVPDQPVLSAVLVLGVAGLLVTPAALHLVAALQTLCLLVLAPERGGVSETVQVLGYATAPCVLAGVPIPGLRVICTAYGSMLLVVGLQEVHDVSLPRSLLAGTVPATLAFGLGFRGIEALATIADALGVSIPT